MEGAQLLKGKVERLHIVNRAGVFANVSMFTCCSEAAGTAEWLIAVLLRGMIKASHRHGWWLNSSVCHQP